MRIPIPIYISCKGGSRPVRDLAETRAILVLIRILRSRWNKDMAWTPMTNTVAGRGMQMHPANPENLPIPE